MDKLKGDSEEAKARFQEKLRKQEQERIAKEKKEKAEALKKIRTQVDDEKKQRIEKSKSKHEPVIPIEKPLHVEAKREIIKKSEVVHKEEPKVLIPKEYDTCLVQCRLPDGNVIQSAQKPESTLYDLALVICQSTGMTMTDFTIVTPFPRCEYDSLVFSSTTCKKAGLVPKGSITIQKTLSKGVILKGNTPMNQDDPMIEDPDNGDIGYPMPMPKPILPVMPTEPEDDDAITRVTKMICQVWLLSNEECPEGTTILVYRPVSFSFDVIVNNRKAICFSDDGTFSETNLVEGVKETQNGTYKLKKNGSELVMVVGSRTTTVEIATITDEVLVLS
jgi:hypothetical protein